MIDINTTVIVEPVLQPKKVVLKRKLTAEEIKKFKKDDLEREEKRSNEGLVCREHFYKPMDCWYDCPKCCERGHPPTDL